MKLKFYFTLLAVAISMYGITSFAQDGNEIVEHPENYAEYKGGADAMIRYLSESIVYPVEALNAGEQGRVFVEFIVEKDGSLSNIKVLRGVSESIDKEALRVIHEMPTWIPGKNKGEPVRTVARVPISFTLSK